MLVDLQLRAEQIWADAFSPNNPQPSEQPHIGALAAILSESTARIDQAYSDTEKQRNIKLYWLNGLCSGEEEDGSPGCTFSAPQATWGEKAYTLTRNKHLKFAVPYRAFETSVFTRVETGAKNQVHREKQLLEGFNTRVHSFLNDPSNLTNYAIAGNPVDPTDNTVVIAPERWNPKVFSLAKRYAMQIGMRDPYIISGAALWDIMDNVKNDTGMNDNVGNVNRLRGHRVYFDLTLDATLGGEEKFFMIDRGALSVLNRPKFGPTPISLDDINNNSGRLAWSYTSSVPNTSLGLALDGSPVGLKLDRHVYRACVNGEDFEDRHAIALSADVVRRPDDECSEDATINGGTFTGAYTGVLAFKCGDPSSVPVGSGSGSGV